MHDHYNSYGNLICSANLFLRTIFDNDSFLIISPEITIWEMIVSNHPVHNRPSVSIFKLVLLKMIPTCSRLDMSGVPIQLLCRSDQDQRPGHVPLSLNADQKGGKIQMQQNLCKLKRFWDISSNFLHFDPIFALLCLRKSYSCIPLLGIVLFFVFDRRLSFSHFKTSSGIGSKLKLCSCHKYQKK